MSIDNAAKAIAAFERTPNSAYDLFVTGTSEAMTKKQVQGMKLFDSVGSIECHSGPAFNGWTAASTDPEFHEFPRFVESPFAARYKLTNDVGRASVTQNEEDQHRFKVPTLRNITLTAPYFHNGAVESLTEAVRVMASTQLDEKLTAAQIVEIIAFLHALEGEFPDIGFIHEPVRQFSRDRSQLAEKSDKLCLLTRS